MIEMQLLLSLLLIATSFANAAEEQDVGGALAYKNPNAWKHYSDKFTNPDGQVCTFSMKQTGFRGNQNGIKCGWDGVDSKFQQKIGHKTQLECIKECQKRQWCNWSFTPSLGWGYAYADCFLFGTCNDQTTNEPGGRLYEKKCPNPPKQLRTMHAKMCDPKDGCDKWAKEWWADKMCDFRDCANCDGLWRGDVFDGGDCKPHEMKMTANAHENKAEGPSVLVMGFALFGFGVMAYGAAQHYMKRE